MHRLEFLVPRALIFCTKLNVFSYYSCRGLTRLPLKIQNTYEQTVFADVLDGIDAVMHVRGCVESERRVFAIDRVKS